MMVATFKPGDVVYQEGSNNPHFFVVVSGEFTLNDKPVRYANPQVLMSSEGDTGKFMVSHAGESLCAKIIRCFEGHHAREALVYFARELSADHC